MLSWLVDHSNIIYFLLGALALILLAAGWTTRRLKFWGYAAAAIGCIALFWLMTKFVVSDRQQIILDLDAMASAVVERKSDALIQHFTKDFHYRDLGREEACKRIVAAARTYKIRNVLIWDKNVTVRGDAAEAIFNFRADAEDGGKYPASIKATFVRENGSWKIGAVHVLKLGSTERQFVPGVD